LKGNSPSPFFGGDEWGMADFGRLRTHVLTRLNLDFALYPKLDTWLIASINRPAALAARKVRET